MASRASRIAYVRVGHSVCSRYAAPIPDNPAPTMSASTCSVTRPPPLAALSSILDLWLPFCRFEGGSFRPQLQDRREGEDRQGGPSGWDRQELREVRAPARAAVLRAAVRFAVVVPGSG